MSTKQPTLTDRLRDMAQALAWTIIAQRAYRSIIERPRITVVWSIIGDDLTPEAVTVAADGATGVIMAESAGLPWRLLPDASSPSGVAIVRVGTGWRLRVSADVETA